MIDSKTLLAGRLARLSILCASALVVGLCLAQELEPTGSHAGRRGPRIKPRLTPFPALPRAAGFPILLPNKAQFIEMQALTAQIDSEIVPGLKHDVPTIQCEYGFKKGGIATLYEAPKQPGMNAADFFGAILESGTYHDRQYFKEWSIKGVADKGLMIAVAGTTPAVRDAFIAALGKK